MLAGLLCLASPAAAQSFADFENVGRLEDARQQPSKLGVDGHSFEPGIVYKLFGITTPHVFSAARLGYSDNYLLDDHDAPGVRLRRESYGVFSAGARLDTELGDHRLELRYLGTVNELINTGKLDTLEHTGGARLDLYATDLEAHFDGSWTRSTTPQSIQLRGIVKLDTVVAGGWAEGRIGRFGVRVGGSVIDTDYQEGELDDLDAIQFGAEGQVYWRLQAKLRVLIEYRWTHVRYDEGRRGSLNDYDTHQTLAGIDGTITPKLNASIKVGYTHQNVLPGGPGSNDREFRGWSALASVSYSPLENTTLVATYSRQVSQSTTSNYIRSDDTSIELRQLFYNEKITATVGVGYNRAHVSPGDNLNKFSANCSVAYKIRQWLSVLADYEFNRLGSPFPDQDYRVHTVGISIGVGL